MSIKLKDGSILVLKKTVKKKRKNKKNKKRKSVSTKQVPTEQPPQDLNMESHARPLHKMSLETYTPEGPYVNFHEQCLRTTVQKITKVSTGCRFDNLRLNTRRRLAPLL